MRPERIIPRLSGSMPLLPGRRGLFVPGDFPFSGICGFFYSAALAYGIERFA